MRIRIGCELRFESALRKYAAWLAAGAGHLRLRARHQNGVQNTAAFVATTRILQLPSAVA